jgi:hypothetical protein
MSAATDAWSAWRENQVEADERDIPAREAYLAGWAAADRRAPADPHGPWHSSLATVLIVALIVAAICYFLAGAPH